MECLSMLIIFAVLSFFFLDAPLSLAMKKTMPMHDLSKIVTHLGELHWWVGASMIAILSYGKGSWQKFWEKCRPWIESAFLSAIIVILCVTFLKIGVGRLRPSQEIHDISTLGWNFSPISWSASSWSCPSGHTATIFTIATLLRSFVPAWIVYGCAACIGATRVLLNVHFLSDVFLGAWIGIVIPKTILRKRGQGPSLSKD